MNDIIINDFEKAILDFTQFVSLLFKDNLGLQSFSLYVTTTHYIEKGIKISEHNHLHLDTIQLQSDEQLINCYNSLIFNQLINSSMRQKSSFEHSFYVIEPSFTSNMNALVIGNLIKKQSLFQYADFIKKYHYQYYYKNKNLRWSFFRNNIDSDIKNFIGQDLERKVRAIELYQTLSLQKINTSVFRYKI